MKKSLSVRIRARAGVHLALAALVCLPQAYALADGEGFVYATGYETLVSAVASATQTAPSQSEFQALSLEEFGQLDSDTQVKYLDSFRAAIEALDADGRGSGNRAGLDRRRQLRTMLALLSDETMSLLGERDAHADSQKDQHMDKSYCVNAGVFAPCSNKEGHTFDTSEYLEGIGGKKGACGIGKVQCSPAYGFTKDGALFCSANDTGSCADSSKKSGGHQQLIEVMQKCTQAATGVVLKEPNKTVKGMSCEKLGKFLKAQGKFISTRCDESGRKSACKAAVSNMSEIAATVKNKADLQTLYGNMRDFADPLKPAAAGEQRLVVNRSGQVSVPLPPGRPSEFSGAPNVSVLPPIFVAASLGVKPGVNTAVSPEIPVRRASSASNLSGGQYLDQSTGVSP